MAVQRLDRDHYAETFDRAPIVRLITDRFGAIREANRAAAEMFGLPPAILVGKPITMFVPLEDRGEFRRRIVEAVAAQTPTRWVSWLRPHERPAFRGELHVVGSESELGTMHWAITDVTERIALAEELRLLAAELEERVRERTAEVEAERARLAAVIDRMPAGLVIVGADGKVVTANLEARRLFGEDLESIAAIGDGSSGRAELARDDGSTVPVDIHVAAIAEAPGADTLYLVYDATARERNDRAEREFVTNAAHQLQSPLAGILSAVEVLQFGAKDRPERDVFLGHIEREARRLARLTRALLILARAQTGYEAPKDEIVALAPLLEETAAALRRREGVAVEISCDSSLAVLTSRELLEQALANVAENAAKYTTAGRITLAARPHESSVQIVVTDTGPGIPDHDRDRVLEQFYRAAPTGAEGFGLGFAIVRAAVEAVDGKLSVESEVGVGTTVRMDLPRPASIVEP